jgi:peroxiredoxin Q/BCP
MALENGKKAPDFALPDENGGIVKLSKLKGQRVIVFFFPKAGTPG